MHNIEKMPQEKGLRGSVRERLVKLQSSLSTIMDEHSVRLLGERGSTVSGLITRQTAPVLLALVSGDQHWNSLSAALRMVALWCYLHRAMTVEELSERVQDLEPVLSVLAVEGKETWPLGLFPQLQELFGDAANVQLNTNEEKTAAAKAIRELFMGEDATYNFLRKVLQYVLETYANKE